jgi:hypothetical protein
MKKFTNEKYSPHALKIGIIAGSLITPVFGYAEVQVPNDLKLHVHSFEGGAVSTENGFGLQAGARFESGKGPHSTLVSKNRADRIEPTNGKDGGWATLVLNAGFPALRLAGHSELIPVKVLQQKLDIEGHDAGVDIVIIPLAGNFQLDAGSRGRSHLIIEPTVAAQLKIATHSGYRGRARLLLGAAAGGTSDADGSAGILGVRTGADFDFEVDLSAKDRIKFSAGGAIINSVTDDLDPRAWEAGFKMGYERDLGDASTVGIQMVYQGIKLDPISDGHQNDLPSTFSGFTVSYTPAN